MPVQDTDSHKRISPHATAGTVLARFAELKWNPPWTIRCVEHSVRVALDGPDDVAHEQREGDEKQQGSL